MTLVLRKSIFLIFSWKYSEINQMYAANLNSLGFSEKQTKYNGSQETLMGIMDLNHIYFNDSPSKIMKKAFYFILKALFVLKILKFLS